MGKQTPGSDLRQWTQTCRRERARQLRQIRMGFRTTVNRTPTCCRGRSPSADDAGEGGLEMKVRHVERRLPRRSFPASEPDQAAQSARFQGEELQTVRFIRLLSALLVTGLITKISAALVQIMLIGPLGLLFCRFRRCNMFQFAWGFLLCANRGRTVEVLARVGVSALCLTTRRPCGALSRSAQSTSRDLF